MKVTAKNFMTMKSKLIKNNINILLYFLGGIVFVIDLLFIFKYGDNIINSDMSSEILLGKICKEEGKLLTTNWYYSTEIHLWNIQLIHSLVFCFTANWKLVRVMSAMILYFLLWISIKYCFKPFNKHVSPLLSIVLFLPISCLYFDYVLFGLYYIPFLIISFISVGLYERIDEKKSWLFLVIIAFISSIGSPRYFCVIFFPIAISIVINTYIKDKVRLVSFIMKAVALIISSCAGYAINVIFLSKIYHYKKWDDILFSQGNYSRIGDIINDALEILGYRDGTINVQNLFRNGFSILLLVLSIVAIYKIIKKKNLYSRELVSLTIFFLCNLVIYILMYIYLDIPHGARYSLFTFIYLYPIFLIWVCEEKALDGLYKKCVLIFILFGCFITSYFILVTYKNVDLNNELRKVSDYLVSSDIKNGYASFWNANVITELSNGEIETWAWQCYAIDEIDDIDKVYPWLQKKSHMDEKPSGKVFILLEDYEYDCWPLKDNLCNNIVLKENGYVLMVFNNYNDIVSRYRN